MLTVMREWTYFLYQRKENYNDFRKAITESLDVLHRSLEETKNKLGVLTKHNVVDAGANGFVLFIEGVFDLIWVIIEATFEKSKSDCALDD